MNVIGVCDCIPPTVNVIGVCDCQPPTVNVIGVCDCQPPTVNVIGVCDCIPPTVNVIGVPHCQPPTVNVIGVCVCIPTLQGEYGACRDSVESALAVVGRPVPTSSFSLALTLAWTLFSHLVFQVVSTHTHTHAVQASESSPCVVLQVMLGRVGVFLASVLERRAPLRGVASSGKKHGFRVTSSEIAQAYHLLHQINMAGRARVGVLL